MKKKDMNLEGAAKELVEVRLTVKRIWDIFYDIMQRNGICEGTKMGAGVNVDNPEWTMCKALFLQRVIDSIELEALFMKPEKMPKGVWCYEEEELTE